MMAQILYAFLGAVVVGVVLILIGLRGKKLNDHPVCRWCGFDLEGVFPGGVTCPECGAGLKRAKAVRQGARRKRWVAFSVGTLCVVLPVVTFVLVGGAMLSGADMNKHKPFGLLLLEARHAGPSLAQAAAKEFLSRLQDNTLTTEQVERLAAEALTFQADLGRPWFTEWGDLIEQARGQGILSKEDHQRYMDQSAVIQCKVRPTVGMGERVPVLVTLKEARGGSGSQFYVMVILDDAKIGGVEASRSASRQYRFFNNGGKAAEAVEMMGYLMVMSGANAAMFGGWGGGASTTLGPDESVEVGPAVVELALRCVGYEMNAMGGGSSWGAPTKGGVQHSVVVPTRITGANEPTLHMIPASDEIANQLAQALTPDHVMQYPNTGFGTASDRMLNISFSTAGARTPFAFEVYARFEGKEVKLGEVSSGEEAHDPSDVMYGGGSGGGGQRVMMASIRDTFPTTIDIVFKPSERVGKRTIDLKEIYGGEVVVKNVTVEP